MRGHRLFVVLRSFTVPLVDVHNTLFSVLFIGIESPVNLDFYLHG